MKAAKYIIVSILLVGLYNLYYFVDSKYFLVEKLKYNELEAAKYASATQIISNNENITGILYKDTDGIELFLDPVDPLITAYIMNLGSWEDHMRNVFKQYVKPGQRILTLGAHIGSHVVLLSKLIGEKGKIFAFEPNPAILKFLKANLYFNSIDNVILYEKAAYSKNEPLKFFAIDQNQNSGGSYVVTEDKKYRGNGKEIIVEAVRIDDNPEISNVDVIQMDIEGAEPEAIKGAENLIKNSNDLLVFQEWSVSMMGKDAAVEYIKFWRDKGYKFAEISCRAITEVSDAELLELPLTDIIMSKNLDTIIKNFKTCREFRKASQN